MTNIQAIASSAYSSFIKIINTCAQSLWNIVKFCFNAIALCFINLSKIIIAFTASVGTYFGASTTIAAVALGTLTILIVSLIVIFGIKYYKASQIADDAFIHVGPADKQLSGTAIGEKAIEFARKQLRKYPKTKPYKFEGPLQQKNPEIALLTTLYWDVYEKNLRKALHKYRNDNPWDKKDVIKAADACMKISYAISCLTLEDFKKDPTAYTAALSDPNSYPHITLTLFVNKYYSIRTLILFAQRTPSRQQILERFYENGTLHNQWRALFNNHCDQVRAPLSESQWNQLAPGFVRRAQNDTALENFSYCPA